MQCFLYLPPSSYNNQRSNLKQIKIYMYKNNIYVCIYVYIEKESDCSGGGGTLEREWSGSGSSI